MPAPSIIIAPRAGAAVVVIVNRGKGENRASSVRPWVAVNIQPWLAETSTPFSNHPSNRRLVPGVAVRLTVIPGWKMPGSNPRLLPVIRTQPSPLTVVCITINALNRACNVRFRVAAKLHGVLKLTGVLPSNQPSNCQPGVGVAVEGCREIK